MYVRAFLLLLRTRIFVYVCTVIRGHSIAVDQIYFQLLSRNAGKMFNCKLLYQKLTILEERLF